MLERVEVYTQTYADDISILVSGKCGGWKDGGARCNGAGSKYQRKIVHKEAIFGQVRRDLNHDVHLSDNKELKMNGWNLQDRVRLDTRLIIKIRLEFITTKAMRALWASSRYMGGIRKLKAKVVH